MSEQRQSRVSRAWMWIAGAPMELPSALLLTYPELDGARWRRGGLALRVGGWCLGKASVSGFALWRTVWIASTVTMDAELLLHELRHVHQFQSDSYFPLRYVWRSMRYGYLNNPYEADARAFAARRSSAQPTE